MNTAQAAPHPGPAAPPPSTPPTPTPPGSIRLLAALPIPALLLAMVVLSFADIRTTFESPYLLLAMDFLTRTVACLLILYLAGRTFLTRGGPGLLLLGCGVAIWGTSGFVATSTLTHSDANLGITISNLGIWLAALCHLAGVVLSLRSKLTLRPAGLWLGAGYTLALGAVGLIVLSICAGWLPVFFVEGQGGTPVRHIVLGSALAMFALTAVLLWEGNHPSLSSFARWYMLALLLIAVGIFGMILQSSRDSLLNWTCRAAQYLSGIYMLVAALGTRRELDERGISLGQALGQPRYRYGVALSIVCAAAALRLAFFPVLGTRVLFITFYPAVMLAALYGGLRAGLLAALLSVLVVDYFWIGPVGFALPDSADWLAMALFLASCTMICAIIQALHRAQARAAEAQTEARVVAERQQAAEALRQKEAELEKALRIAHIGSWYWDAKTDVTTGSDELLRIYGFDPATQAMPDFKNQRGRCYPVDDWERVNAAVQRTVETGAGYELDVQAIRNGIPIWVTTRGELVRDADGKIAGLRGTVQDITERRRVEEALRERDARFTTLLANLESGVALVGEHGQFELCNASFLRIFGLTSEVGNVNSQDWGRWQVFAEQGELLPVDDHPARKAARSRKPVRNQLVRVKRPSDGVELWLLVSAEPVLKPDGRLHQLICTYYDITERKRAEEALRASEARLQRLMEMVPIPLGVVNKNGEMVFLNEGFIRVFGYTQADTPTLEAWWQRAHPDAAYRRRVRENWEAKMLRAAQTHAASEPEEFNVTCKDGTVRVVLISNITIEDNILASFIDITDRKQAEEALRLSEEKFALAFANNPAAISMTSLDDGRFLEVNDTWLALNGYRREELAGVTARQLPVWPTPQARARFVQELREKGSLRGWDQEFMSKSGEVYVAQLSATVLTVRGEKVILSTLVDITEQRRAEEGVRRREEQLHSLADSILNLAWWANGDGYITWYNRRWYEYTGTTPEQMEGWGWQSVHDPQMLPEIMERWKASIATGEPFDMTFPLRGADGRFRSFLTRAQPLKDAQGRVVQWFGTNTDVDELKRSEEAMREAEERLRFALETCHTGAWDLDVVDRTAFRSLEHDRVFGYPELLPEWTYEMFLEHVLLEDRVAVDAKFSEAIVTQGVWDFECRIRRADGEVRWIWGAGRHRADAAGGKRRMAGIVQDVTERKQAEEAIKASLREKEVLLKEIHHRVKNNLQVISSLVELQTNSLDDPVLRGLFRDVRNRVRSMALVHEKLYQSDTLASVDFADYTRSLIGFLSRAHGGSETTVRFKLDLQPVSLPVERAVPCGLILNELVTNAFKHAFRGRAEGEVTTALSTGPDGRVSLRVSDDGVGLPAGMDWRQSRSLGLQLIHLLAGQLDATVEVRTSVGTEFLISFEQPQRAEAGERTHA